MVLQPRELATVLAALRHWQATVVNDRVEPAYQFPHFDDEKPLTAAEIDPLCDYLNEAVEPCPCEGTGFFTCGVPGVLACVENGKVVPGTTVERCDACGRFESDDAARQKLVELGLL